MSAQRWINRIWYEGVAPPWSLLPLSQAYRGVAAARRFLYRHGLRRVVRVAAPVIVVGNLSVGGTGKTPLVLWLVAALRACGYTPGIVTRGYGGSAKQPCLIDATADPALVGDEPVLLARRSGADVAVGRERPRAAQLLIDAGCDVIVSDDGLQHYALARDCELAVVDGTRLFGNGRLLPAGPLRELPQRLASVDAVIVNGDSLQLSGALVMRLVAQRAIALQSGVARPLQEFAGSTVHAVAGIGNPARFFSLLRAAGLTLQEQPLDDHARLVARDICFTDRNPVLMTEKDAVKCTGLTDERHWYVPVEACFDAADAERLMAIVVRKIGAARAAPAARANDD
jgi:tetraacyldisaccharide 4'-kinase